MIKILVDVASRHEGAVPRRRVGDTRRRMRDERRLAFGSVAEQYDRARPTYPA